MAFELKDVLAVEYSLIHQLNESETPHVSSVTPEELEALAKESIYFRKVCDGEATAGFLLGFDDSANYKSMNYRWFLERYKSFFYIDRIVVAANYRRRGVGRMLYEDVDRFSQSKGMSSVTCEVNVLPPNPESLAYHESLGFNPVGEQDTEGGKKRVRLMIKNLS